MMSGFQKFLLAIALNVLIISCSKDEVGPSGGSNDFVQEGVVVINEGNFGRANASLSVIPDSGEVINTVFQTANARVLGDVLQSVVPYKNDYFLIVNNSGKIERVRKQDFTSIATIDGLQSPRYMLILDQTRALVTSNNFSDDSVNLYLLNIEQNVVEREISVAGGCEDIVFYDDVVVIANEGRNRLLFMDPMTFEIRLIKDTPLGPKELMVDSKNQLWVLCAGDFVTTGSAMAFLKDAESNVEVVEQFPFGVGLKNVTEFEGDIYFLSDGVYKYPGGMGESVLVTDQDMSYPYGFAIQPKSGNLFVGDALFFQGNGKVLEFNNSGNLLNSYQAGVGPNGFIFE